MEEDTPDTSSRSPSSARSVIIAVVSVVVGIVVGMAAVLAVPGIFGLGAAPERPVIGTVFPITGDLERFGTSMKNAARLAQIHISDEGGVLGTDLSVINEDSVTKPADGVIAARKLIDVDGATAIIGAAASGVSQPILEGVTGPGRIVQISPSSTSAFFTTFNEAIANEADRFFFRTAPSDSAQGIVAADYAFNTLNWRNVAILARTDTYGQGLAGTFESTFTSFAGTSITNRVNYDIGLPSYSTEIDLIFSGNPDGIYWVAFPTEGLIMMEEWWADTTRRDVAWLGGDGVRDGPFWQEVSEVLQIDTSNQEGTAPTASLSVGDNAAQFVTDYVAEFGVEPTTFASNVYDAVFTVAMAMQAGGGVSGQTIRDNLVAVSGGTGTVIQYGDWAGALTAIAAGAVNYEGASGSVNYDAFGDVLSDYEVWIYNTVTQAMELKVRIAEADIPTPSSPLLAPLLASATGLWLPIVATRD